MAVPSERAPLLSSPTEAGPSNWQMTGENTPLLTEDDDGPPPSYHGGDYTSIRRPQSVDDDSLAPSSKKHSPSRWPSYIAITLLVLTLSGILVFVYFVPAAIEEYAKQGVVVEPTNLSLESLTADGVRARIQANFRLDGSRVKNEHVRRIGRAATWVVGQLGTEKTTVHVFLPDYGNVLLGSAEIPALVVSLVDGRTTALDIVTDLSPGDADGIRSIANQWLDGQLNTLRVQGKADIQLRSGILPLGTHAVSESLAFEANDLPEIPQYSIDRINFEEVRLPGNNKAMGAEVSVSAFNKYPFQLDIPSLGFEVLVPNCNPLDSYILIADAITEPIAVRPQSRVVVEVNGTVQELPESLTAHCPNSESSPLDLLLKQYMSGQEATVFVRGRKQHADGTPDWIGDILSSVTVPVPFPGRTFDNLIRNFSMTDVQFTMPDPMAEPGEPGSNPTVSGNIFVVAGMPSEMNFAINVTKFRANANVSYHGNKLGELPLNKWQAANSTMTKATEHHEATLTIQSRIDNAALIVTDGDVLTQVIQKLLFDGSDVNLDIDALVDICVDTVLGQFTLKDVPAAGNVPIKPLPHGSIGAFAPKVNSIQILDTTAKSITLEASVNMTNPTEYAAHIPSLLVDILCNGTVVGTAQAKNLDIKTGNNANIVLRATWHPAMSGENGSHIGRDLLSQYISGFETNITTKTHRDSFPLQPLLGDVLSKFNFTIPTPRLRLPGSKDSDSDEKKHSFIRAATFHVFSSRANFRLVSPLQKKTLYIETIHANAYYNHTEPVGSMHSNIPFAVHPGVSDSPKLPVQWYPDSVGFDKLLDALGGELKLDAEARVGVRLGAWRETLWYVGRGIGARVRP